MQNQALYIPNCDILPDEISVAKQSNKLAIFIGAGFPKNFGCWDWDRIVREFLSKCETNKLINARERTNYVDAFNKKGITSQEMI